MLVYILIFSNVTIITLLKWSLWHSLLLLRWLLLSLFVGYHSPDRPPATSYYPCQRSPLRKRCSRTQQTQITKLGRALNPSFTILLLPYGYTRSCQTPTPCLRTISDPDEEVVVGLTQMTKVGKMKTCLRIPRHKWPGGERRGGVTAGTNVVSHPLCPVPSSKSTKPLFLQYTYY